MLMETIEKLHDLLEKDPFLEDEVLSELVERLEDRCIRDELGLLFNDCYERLPRDIAVRMCEILRFDMNDYQLGDPAVPARIFEINKNRRLL
jgi:hypothetical protein